MLSHSSAVRLYFSLFSKNVLNENHSKNDALKYFCIIIVIIQRLETQALIKIEYYMSIYYLIELHKPRNSM